jgi:hypothetical protein
MKNYPAEYYATEKSPIKLIGYTLSLGMAAVGAVETIQSIYHKLQSHEANIILGPAVFIAGGATAYLYLKEAGVVY